MAEACLCKIYPYIGGLFAANGWAKKWQCWEILYGLIGHPQHLYPGQSSRRREDRQHIAAMDYHQLLAFQWHWATGCPISLNVMGGVRRLLYGSLLADVRETRFAGRFSRDFSVRACYRRAGNN